MEKEKGLEEVDVYRSSHTNSCFNKRITEGLTYTYRPYVQQWVFGVCFACGKEGNDWQSQPGETRHIVESSYERENVSDCITVEKTHFFEIISTSVLHNRHSSTQRGTFFCLYQSFVFSLTFLFVLTFLSFVAPSCHRCHTAISLTSGKH